jgi:3-dehydroquinate dehydratase-1
MKLCVSLTEKSVKKCVDVIHSCGADMIEHRMDFMSPIEGLERIYHLSEKPIITTCRSAGRGGYFTGTEKQRIKHLLDAISAGASYIDIELGTNPKDIELLRKEMRKASCKLIASKHFHYFTPSSRELLELVDTLRRSNADIIKIVTTPKSIGDCKKVLQLYHVVGRTTLPMIAFAMGDLGKFTRVCALFLGAPFMYVSQDKREVAAPGQISFSQMKMILEVLK